VAERRKAQEEWKKENPEMAAKLADWIAGRLPELDWNVIPLKEGMATRAASAAVLGYLAKHVENMIVSSADLANSDKTDGFLKNTRPLVRGDFGGAFLHAGVAELTMACLMNGMSLHGGVIPACGTFFVFSDYMKPAIRLSALMEQPVKYIFSHDSFRVGEDGPTHEPIEQETQIRLLERMNNLSGRRAALVLRPADSAETVEAYRLAMENNDSPMRTALPAKSGARGAEARGLSRGAYAVVEAVNPDVILLGDGSEVSLLCDTAALLADSGIKARVVSVPSVGLFLEQDREYRDALLPADSKMFAVSSGLPDLFYPIVGRDAELVGLRRFGASAPAGVLDVKFGFTAPDMAEKVKHFLRF